MNKDCRLTLSAIFLFVLKEITNIYKYFFSLLKVSIAFKEVVFVSVNSLVWYYSLAAFTVMRMSCNARHRPWTKVAHFILLLCHSHFLWCRGTLINLLTPIYRVWWYWPLSYVLHPATAPDFYITNGNTEQKKYIYLKKIKETYTPLQTLDLNRSLSI